MIGRVQMEFDSNGNPTQRFVAHPVTVPELQKVASQIENDPELKRKHEELLQAQQRHGLLARVIENWLTSVNERQYRGETILYVSSHGPYEKGKDVITRATNAEIHAFH